jgi:hypothetical protein
MNIFNKPKKEVEPAPILEPFPEPRTMPGGWDLSALVSVPVSGDQPTEKKTTD